jgi:hypothetical protein
MVDDPVEEWTGQVLQDRLGGYGGGRRPSLLKPGYLGEPMLFEGRDVSRINGRRDSLRASAAQPNPNKLQDNMNTKKTTDQLVIQDGRYLSTHQRRRRVDLDLLPIISLVLCVHQYGNPSRRPTSFPDDC